MGLRFRKSFKIAPGVKVNLNKKSASMTVGTKGAHYTVNSKGKKTASVGIPGTGVSYTTSSQSRKQRNKSIKSTSSEPALTPDENISIQNSHITPRFSPRRGVVILKGEKEFDDIKLKKYSIIYLILSILLIVLSIVLVSVGLLSLMGSIVLFVIGIILLIISSNYSRYRRELIKLMRDLME